MDPVSVLAKFEIRSFLRSWDNRVYRAPHSPPAKNGQSLDMPTLQFHGSNKWTFDWMDPMNVLAKFETRSLPRSPEGTQKLGCPWICPISLSWKIFNGLLFG